MASPLVTRGESKWAFVTRWELFFPFTCGKPLVKGKSLCLRLSLKALRHFFQVFCYVAQRMTAEGSEKTWDQCRIKLKNLKSQYRYVKDRIPNIDEVDLEDDDVLKQLIAECQGRGISPSNIKHLRLVK